MSHGVILGCLACALAGWTLYEAGMLIAEDLRSRNRRRHELGRLLIANKEVRR